MRNLDNKILPIIIITLCFTLTVFFIIDQEKYHPYDVNRDGKVNITDYEILKDYFSK